MCAFLANFIPTGSDAKRVIEENVVERQFTCEKMSIETLQNSYIYEF